MAHAHLQTLPFEHFVCAQYFFGLLLLCIVGVKHDDRVGTWNVPKIIFCFNRNKKFDSFYINQISCCVELEADYKVQCSVLRNRENAI